MIEWTLQFLLGAALGWIYVLIVAISYYVGVAAFRIQEAAKDDPPWDADDLACFGTFRYKITRYEP